MFLHFEWLVFVSQVTQELTLFWIKEVNSMLCPADGL